MAEIPLGKGSETNHLQDLKKQEVLELWREEPKPKPAPVAPTPVKPVAAKTTTTKAK
jgi:hypothetical protein